MYDAHGIPVFVGNIHVVSVGGVNRNEQFTVAPPPERHQACSTVAVVDLGYELCAKG
jgi:hypothetical protein